MTTQNISIQADLTVNNRQANAAVDQTSKNIDKLISKAKSANLGGSNALSQATSGSSKFMASAPKSSAEKLADRAEDELYRNTRGMRGTGAEGRDFAKQAQGLGGLVHVYATFAANLFAVSAAFGALSKAADTTNMVAGLNQLGAASGKNLGSMAKRMTELTDGAISLRTAMEATAQASAAGMSGQQMERMTVVAKKASQALGRDMTDAMSRLSRGITKMEPELLDELGIFTRVDKAAQEYARTVGKSVTSLTDFEKRQAFANAALKEAETKFNAIELDSNPYNKLLASMTNLALKGGELMNNVLGPIAKILAESPTALGVAMAGIAGMLLSKAIPALTQWRSGLVESAKQAAVTAAKLHDLHRDFAIGREIASGRMITQPLEKSLVESTGKIQELMNNTFKGGKLLKLVNTDDFAVTESFAKKINSEASKLEGTLRTQSAVQATLLAKGVSLTDSEKRQLDLINKQVISTSDKLANARLIHQKALDTLEVEKRLTAENEKQAMQMDTNKGSLEEQGIAARAKRAQDRATQSLILSNVGQNTQIMGMSDAWKRMRAEIKYGTEAVEKYTSANGGLLHGIEKSEEAIKSAGKGLGVFRGAMTSVIGGAQILTSGVMNLVSAFQGPLIVIGLLTSAFALLDSWLSTAGKEIEEFESSLKTLSEATAGTKRTFEYLYKQNIVDPKNTQAAATSINELYNSLNSAVLKFKEAKEAMSGWEKAWDFLNSHKGEGVLRIKATEEISKSIYQALKSPINPADKKIFQEKLSNIFNIKDFSTEGIKKAIKEIPTEELDNKLALLTEETNKFNIQINNAASRLTSFSDAAVSTEKALQDLQNSFVPSDSMSKFAIAQGTQAFKLAEALDAPQEAVHALATVISDFNKLKLYSPESQALLTKYKSDILDFTSKTKLAYAEIERLKGVKEDLKKNKSLNYEEDLLNTSRMRQVDIAISKLEEGIEGAAKDTARLEKLATEVVSNEINSSIDKLIRGYQTATEQAALKFQQTVAAGITGVAGVEIRADLQMKEIDLRIEQLSLDREMITQVALLNANLKLTDAEKNKGDVTHAVGVRNFTERIASGESLSTLTEAFKDLAPKVKAEVYALYNSYLGYAQKMAGVGSERAAVQFTKDLGLLKEEHKYTLEIEKIKAQSLNIEKSVLNSMYDSLPIYSEVLSIKIRDNALALNNAKLEENKIAHEEKINQLGLEWLSLKGNEEARTKIINEMNKVEGIFYANQKLLKQQQSLELIQLDINFAKKKLEYEEKILAANNKIAESKRKVYDAEIKLQQAQLDVKEELGVVSKVDAIEERYRLEEKLRKSAHDAEILALQQSIEMENRKLELQKLEFSLFYKRAYLEIETNKTLSAEEKSKEKLSLAQSYMSVVAEINSYQSKITESQQAQVDSLNQVYSIESQINELQKDRSKFMEQWGSAIKVVEDALTGIMKSTMEKDSRTALKKVWEDFKQGAKDLVFEFSMKPQIEQMKNAFISILPGGKELLEKSKSLPEKQLARLEEQKKIAEQASKANLDSLKSLQDTNKAGFSSVENAIKDLKPTIKEGSDKVSQVTQQGNERTYEAMTANTSAILDDSSGVGANDPYNFVSASEGISSGASVIEESAPWYMTAAKTLWSGAKTLGGSVSSLVQGIWKAISGGGSSGTGGATGILSQLLGNSGLTIGGNLLTQGNSLVNYANTALGNTYGTSAFSEQSMMLANQDYSGFAGGSAGGWAGAVTPYVGSIMQAIQGDLTGAAINAALTYAFSWTGPFAPIIGSIGSSLLSGLFGGGTPHKGAMGFSGGEDWNSSGNSAALQAEFAGPPTWGTTASRYTSRYMPEVADSLKPITQGLAKSVNATSKLYGGASNYRVGTRFASDGDDDSRAAVVILDSNKNIVYNSGTKKYDEDPAKGMEQFVADVPRIMLRGFREMDLGPIVNTWLDKSMSGTTDLISKLTSDDAGILASLLSSGLVDDILENVDIVGMSFQEVNTTLAKFVKAFPLKSLMDAMNIDFFKLGLQIAESFASVEQAGELMANYYSLYYSDSERLTASNKALRTSFNDLGITMPTTMQGFRSIVEGLDLTTEEGRSTYAALMQLAPAFASVASAADEITNTFAQLVLDIQDMKFSFEYDTKDPEGKYNMLNTKATAQYNDLAKNIDTMDATTAAEAIRSLTETIQTSWGLLDDDQKKAQLPEYLKRLDDLEMMAAQKGVTELSKLSADGIGTVAAIDDSANRIVAAIEKLDPTASAATTKVMEEITSGLKQDYLNSLVEESRSLGFRDFASTAAEASAPASSTAAEASSVSEDAIITNLISKMVPLITEATTPSDITTVDKEAEKNRLFGAFSTEVSTELASTVENTNSSIIGLKEGTASLTDVAASLTSLINSLVAVAKQPANVNVSFRADLPGIAEVNGGG